MKNNSGGREGMWDPPRRRPGGAPMSVDRLTERWRARQSRAITRLEFKLAWRRLRACLHDPAELVWRLDPLCDWGPVSRCTVAASLACQVMYARVMGDQPSGREAYRRRRKAELYAERVSEVRR